MLRRLQRHANRIFAVALVTVAGGAALADYHAAQRIRAERLVSHTHDVLLEFEAAVAELNQAESSERGYALTGDEAFVPPFEHAGALVARHLANVRALLTDDPQQQRRVDNLARGANDKVDAMRAVIRSRRAGVLDSAALVSAVVADETDISGIRDSVLALERDERQLLATRREALDASARHTSWAVWTLGLASLAMLGLAYATAQSAQRQQRVAERRTLEANAELRVRVEELVWRGQEAAGLHQLSEALQICLTPEEAHAAVARIVPELSGLAGSSGFLAVTRASPQQVDWVAHWGTPAVDDACATMAPDDCCALRSGRPYVVRAGDVRLRCAHAAGVTGDYICLPLAAHGETFGVLHVAFPPGGAGADRAGEPAHERGGAAAALYESGAWPSADAGHARLVLLRRAGEQIAIALANLALRDRLKQQSIRDALTGAFNRRWFEESLDREIMRARRHGRGLALVMFDVDHFKRVNDQHGHEAGDEVLRSMADVLQRAVREVDVVCRFGGEEFAVLLPEITPEAALQRTQRIVEACRPRRIMFRGEPIGPVTLSAGLAHLSPGETGADLVRRADTALYTAKRAGRDRVEEATAAASAPSREHAGV